MERRSTRLTRRRTVLGGLVAFLGACTGVIDVDPSAGNGPGSNLPPGSIPSPLCEGQPVQAGGAPLRRLTREEYRNTVRDLLGIDPGAVEELGGDERAGRFESNATNPIGELLVEAYAGLAARVAGEATVAPMAFLPPCDSAVDGEAACATRFVEHVGRRALRRPLDDEERTALLAVFEVGAEVSFADGVRLVIEALLQSPDFLYHVHVGSPGEVATSYRPLEPYALAERLSYFLWKSMPDEELFAAAASGALAEPAALRTEAERMMDDPRAQAAIGSFHLQWMEVAKIDRMERNPELYPTLDGALRSAMRQDTVRFADAR